MEETDPTPAVAEAVEEVAEATSDDKNEKQAENALAEDSGDDSTVLVDHEDVDEQPRALQVVSIGTEEDCKAYSVFCIDFIDTG